MRERLNPLEYILWARRLEVREKLFIDDQVGRENEEISAHPRHEKVADERPHQPRLAYSGRQREAQANELPLELLDVRIDTLERRQRAHDINVLA